MNTKKYLEIIFVLSLIVLVVNIATLIQQAAVIPGMQSPVGKAGGLGEEPLCYENTIKGPEFGPGDCFCYFLSSPSDIGDTPQYDDYVLPYCLYGLDMDFDNCICVEHTPECEQDSDCPQWFDRTNITTRICCDGECVAAVSNANCGDCDVQCAENQTCQYNSRSTNPFQCMGLWGCCQCDDFSCSDMADLGECPSSCYNKDIGFLNVYYEKDCSQIMTCRTIATPTPSPV